MVFLARPLQSAWFYFGSSFPPDNGLFGVRLRKVLPISLIAPPLGNLLIYPRSKFGDFTWDFEVEAQGEDGGALSLFQLCCSLPFKGHAF